MYIKFFFIVYFTFFSITLFTPHLDAFPDDEVLSIDKQIHLYRKAYEPFHRDNLNIHTTHVPGLIPLVRMGYSYMKELIRKDEEGLTFLNRFWTETETAIIENKLTLPCFKNTNNRLAYLLSKVKIFQENIQEGAETVRSEYIPQSWHNTEFVKSGDWLDLKNYERLHRASVIQPYPFSFEAVLYHKEGEIPLESFLDGYLANDITLGLSALPEIGEGPHGNYYKDSVMFKYHDDIHWMLLAEGFKEHPQLWEHARRLMRKIYRSSKLLSSFDKVGIFFLLHETECNATLFLPQISSESTPYISTKDLPFSEALIFASWVNRAATLVYESSNIRGIAFQNLTKEIPLKIEGLPIYLESFPHSEEYLAENFYKFDIDLNTPSSYFKKDLPSKGEDDNDNPDVEAIGKAKAYGLFESIGKQYREKFTLLRLEDITLTAPESFYGNLNTSQEAIQKGLLALQNYSEVIDSRFYNYSLYVQDLDKLMGQAYGETPSSTPPPAEEVKNKTLKFLREFYEKHKDLFSDKPYNSQTALKDV